jgi:hypothetical protein
MESPFAMKRPVIKAGNRNAAGAADGSILIPLDREDPARPLFPGHAIGA